MNQRFIRTLPFPPTSHFTLEVVRQIKAIPDEEIAYTDAEVAWMKRALENLEYMLAQAEASSGEVEHLVRAEEYYTKLLADAAKARTKS